MDEAIFPGPAELLEGPNGYNFVHSDPLNKRDPFGLVQVPEIDSDSCMDNCLDRRRNWPGMKRAIKKHAIGHVFGTIGTGVCGVAAVLEGGANLLADVGFVGFGVFEAYEINESMNDAADLKREARAAYASCLMKCATKWGDFEDAYDRWQHNK